MRYLLVFFAAIILASCGNDTNGLTPEEYVKENNLQATELENGVYIVIHEPGNEVRAGLQSIINVSYTGKLTTEEVFDSNDDYKARLGNLITGWHIGLSQLGEGGSCTLIIPHPMAYGGVSNGPIPPNSTLVFEIELKNVFESLSIDEYISKNDLNTVELDKGVQIAIHDPGSDKKPNPDSDVIVNYIGKMTNELVFDEGENASFNLSNLIEGWRIGLLELGEGGSCTLIIPAEVAYGDTGQGIIPPNTPLVFEIELITVDGPTALDLYIEENNLTTTELEKGVHIIIHEEGNNIKPNSNSVVTVGYEGRLTDGFVFDANAQATFNLGGLIEGWRIGLPQIGEEGSCTLFIPPSVGYGSAPNGSIPGNSILIFDIDLIKVD